jgi:hypothetical protein
MSTLVTKEHSYADIVKGSMALTQNKNNPTYAKPVPATILPNNLDTETKTSDCTPKEIYVEIIKMSSPTSQNITPHPSNLQGTPAMLVGYEQFQPPPSNLNANNSKKIKIENDHSQNITPQQPNLQGSPMPMGYEQLKHPQNNLNSKNSGRIKIENEDFLIYDVPEMASASFMPLV